jgi:hypothetical protein
LRNVFGGQCSAMSFDDLAADGQAETGVLAEILSVGTIGVKSLEHALDNLCANSRDRCPRSEPAPSRDGGQTNRDPAARFRHERAGVLDQIGHTWPSLRSWPKQR